VTGHFLYRRREFITLLGGAAAAWPLAASAQQPAMPVVGFLASSSADAPSGPVAAVHLGLKQGGYELGQTVRMEYRYANNQLERLPALAAELVRIPAAVIVTSGGPSPTLVAKASTTTIPIVFAPVPDPVRSGLVTSFNRPGGNITGVAALTIELDPKRLELLRELTPSGGPLGALLNPSRPEGATVLRKQLRRAQVLTFFSRQPRCLVGLEACATAHYWARELRALGHEVRLMPGAIREGLRQAQ
jgi:putative tryptophan/tyrosine transport system substrate-binding protein